MKALVNLIILFSIFSFSSVFAVQITDLYAVAVDVADQSDAERHQALSKALSLVLVKVTGRKHIQQQLDASVFKQAPKWVQQYRYYEEAVPVATESGTASTDALSEIDALLQAESSELDADSVPAQAQAKMQQKLWVQFDSQAIRRLLQQYQLPVWGESRPSLLLWLAIDDGRQRRILNPSQDQFLTQQLQQMSKQRGLPILFPLLDLQDTMAISMADLWGGFSENIFQASERYQAEGILVAKITAHPGQMVSAEWTFYQQGMAGVWQNQSLALSTVLTQGLEHTIEQLAEKFAPEQMAGSNSQISLHISQVQELNDYVELQHYLQSLSIIQASQMTDLDANQITFKVLVYGNVDSLQQAMALDSRFELESQNTLFEDASALYYRWKK